MRVVSHGIDMVSIPSIKQLLETNSAWKLSVYSESERNQSDEPPVDIRYFASRFAGKEAVAKALKTGFAGDVTWREIEILRDSGGDPYVKISGGAERQAVEMGITEWQISISYCGEFAIASVIASGV